MAFMVSAPPPFKKGRTEYFWANLKGGNGIIALLKGDSTVKRGTGIIKGELDYFLLKFIFVIVNCV